MVLVIITVSMGASLYIDFENKVKERKNKNIDKHKK